MRRQLLIGCGFLVACAASGDTRDTPPDIADETSSGSTSAESTTGDDDGDDGDDGPAEETSAGDEGSGDDGPGMGTDDGGDESGESGGQDTGDEPLVPTIPQNTILVVQFEDPDVGPYSLGEWALDWRDPLWENGITAGRVEIIDDGHDGQAMRVHHPANAFGPDDTGGQWHLDFGEGFEEVYVGFWVRFHEDIDWVKGGKLVGLMGGEVHHAGTTPDGFDGWNYRGAWKENGLAAFQVYHMNQSGTYGDTFEWKHPASRYFEAGRWHHIQHHVVMNSPGEANGRLEAWIDGDLAVEIEGLRFREDPGLAVEALRFSTFLVAAILRTTRPKTSTSTSTIS